MVLRVMINEDKAQELYSQGKNDSEIAAALNATVGQVRSWRRRKSLPGNRYAQIDSEKAIKLWKEGWSDRRIAEYFHVSQHAIQNFRRRNNLSARENSISPNLNVIQKLYNEGKSDKTIAKECGISESTVAGWRRKENLEAHRRLHLNEADILSLYRKGLSDPQIAAEVGCSAQTVFRFRKVHGLEANSRPKRQNYNPTRGSTWDEMQALHLYNEGMSDREIAEHLGLAHSTIGAWRRAKGLPAIGKAGRPLRS